MGRCDVFRQVAGGEDQQIVSPAVRGRVGICSNLISTVANQGKVHFTAYAEKMRAPVLIQFMTRLTKAAGRKVPLVLDNLGVHHSKKVKTWLEGRQHQVEVVYLPSYSLELNPDEYLNCDLNARVHSGPPVRSKDDLKRKTIAHLRRVQKSTSASPKLLPAPEDCLCCVVSLFNPRVNTWRVNP